MKIHRVYSRASARVYWRKKHDGNTVAADEDTATEVQLFAGTRDFGTFEWPRDKSKIESIENALDTVFELGMREQKRLFRVFIGVTS